ncbi:hypothetical protein BDF20DRAFT_879978 [Mycotypha africana]|uniref:uncharacterized protein n=1 Tax=Mycotypha africana TaxID=64632 RepID=UPI00230067A8|nr:uncharacterized protein BDF20DRAFT_879978 [Mycotypha africana]KAI8975667.1 hypothetical protein BDF20DRAFT_879978 [Mycotypha africana]
MTDNGNGQIMRLNLSNPSSEFTRRKNWSQSILDALRDVIHVMTADMRLIYCSDASSEFLGYKPAELINRTFTEFLHVDDVDMFAREYRNAKNTMQNFVCTYRFLRKDGKYTTLESRGKFHKNSFFGNARKVPSNVARSMDTFLELKLENEKLMNQLSLLRAQRKLSRTSETSSDHTPSSTSLTTGSTDGGGDDSSDDFDDFNIPLNPPNVYAQGVNASSDANESLAMFTGLRYDLGERSHGISLGLDAELINVPPNHFSSLPIVMNNSDIVTINSSSQDKHRGKKKRVEKPVGMRICTDCGTTESPEWRKGPKGPKTLCNACGLRWSKTQKKAEATR